MFGQQSDEFNIKVFIKYYIYRNNYVISSSKDDDYIFTKPIGSHNKGHERDKMKWINKNRHKIENYIPGKNKKCIDMKQAISL